MKILFFGDIYGRLGRQAVAQVLPVWKQQYQPDAVVANVENMVHGKGVSPETLQDLKELGVGVFTSGNHVFRSGERAVQAFKDFPELIRPQNYGSEYPGKGVCTVTVGQEKLTVVNLNGTTFFENQFPSTIANPFFAFEELQNQSLLGDGIILVDFHAEATSEKVALGWFLDGKVTAVLGTHTHVPTADQRVLPQGTAYVTDVGMCGSMDSVIGVVKENVLSRFLGKEWLPMEPSNSGPSVVNAVLVTTEGRKAVSIERLQKIV